MTLNPRSLTLALFLTALATGASAPLHAAAAGPAFVRLLTHYEPIRLALFQDSTAGIADHAARLQQELEGLAAGFDAARTGVAGDADVARKALQEMAAAAGQLARAGNLEGARAAFYELSKALVRYRAQLDPSELPADSGRVAYCPMARKSWLQPAGPIGNPYYGSEMPTCGQIVGG